MKRTVLFFQAIFLFFVVAAQVQIKPRPKPGYDLRIREYVDNLPVADTHEHLGSQEGFKKCGYLDFMLLLFHYADDDIKSAGMSKPGFQKLLTDSLTVMEKWKAIKPYWEGSSNTAYNRAVLLTVDKLFGIKDINESTVEELSDKIKKAYQTDWYNEVLKKKCGIEYAVIDGDKINTGDTRMFRYVKQFDYISIDSKQSIKAIEKRRNVSINSFDDLVSSMKEEFSQAVEKGIVAVKIAVAYKRILFFDDVKKEKAEAAFNKITASNGEGALSFEEVKPLQDYLTYQILDLARAANLPVQIHTGLQSGDGNIIENANPTHLANLFLKYREVKFILFHGGYPFGGELAALAKNFRNVYLDLCWVYIISPSYSERYLHEWLETVPANKIMAFGGDFMNVEGVYGHLLFAKQIVSKVLADKVHDGYFTEDEARKIARMMLHDNAVRILNLDKP